MEPPPKLSQDKKFKKETMIAGFIGAIAAIIPMIIIYPDITAPSFTSVKLLLILVLSFLLGGIVGISYYRTKSDIVVRVIMTFLLVLLANTLLMFFLAGTNLF